MSILRTCVLGLRQPRYSRLDLSLSLMIVIAGITATAHWFIVRERQFWRETILGSPLPEVTLDPLVDWKQTPVDANRYEFTADYVTSNIPVWQAALGRFRGKPNVHYLEIGVYEGRSLIWVMDNILTHHTSQATAIDVFLGSYGPRYRANLMRSGHADRVTTIADYSQKTLRTLSLDSYDIVYVDGSHAKCDVLEDVVLSWRLLKQGGILIFDDYRLLAQADPDHHECPKMAIDPFVQCFQDQCRVIHNGFQLILEKTGERPGPAPPASHQ